MSIHETNADSNFQAGIDSASGLPGLASDLNRDLFGQPLHKAPDAIDNPLQRLNPEAGTLITGLIGDDLNHPSTGTGNASSTPGGYGDEFQSGIAPIDYAAHLVGNALDQVDKAVETSTPIISQAVHKTITRVADTLQESIDTARDQWNAPDNELRTTLQQRVGQAIGWMKHRIADLSADHSVKEMMHTAIDLGRDLAEKTGDAIQTAQTVTETWVNRRFDDTYLEETPLASAGLNVDKRIAKSDQVHANKLSDQPFVGVIDTGFGKQTHGNQVVEVIQHTSQRSPDWFGDGVGTGGWAESLVQFVDAAKASGQSRAVVNLSFDLTQINPDGRISTRSQLTTTEQAALTYAQEQGVLIVVSSGNQGETMSALGQASAQFNNIIAVGAADGTQRANYSSYGNGLDLVAQGQFKGSTLTGTSLAAANVTGTIAKLWAINPQLTLHQVTQVLESTAKDLNTPGWDAETGQGMLNQAAAIDQVKTDQVKTSDSQLPSTSHRDDRAKPLIQPIESQVDLDEPLTNRTTWSSLNGAIASERPNFIPEGDGGPSSRLQNHPVVTRYNSSTTAADYRIANQPTLGTAITVQSGETLWAIAEKNLGDGNRWKELHQADGSTFTDQEASQLRVGTTVYLPTDSLQTDSSGASTAASRLNEAKMRQLERLEQREALISPTPAPTPTPAPSLPTDYPTPDNTSDNTQNTTQPSLGTAITVQSGETLWAIAEKNLGDGNRWKELHQADGSTFTDQEASQLRVGTTVYLPTDSLQTDSSGASTAASRLNEAKMRQLERLEQREALIFPASAPSLPDSGSTSNSTVVLPPPEQTASIADMGSVDKLTEAFKRSVSRLDDEAGAKLQEFLTPTNLAIMAGTMAAWIASHGTPVGWLVDGALLGVGLFTLGTEVVEVGKDLVNFAKGALEAKTEADLDEAGQHLAEAIATVGVDVVLGLLTRKALGGKTPEEPVPPQNRDTTPTSIPDTSPDPILNPTPDQNPESPLFHIQTPPEKGKPAFYYDLSSKSAADLAATWGKPSAPELNQNMRASGITPPASLSSLPASFTVTPHHIVPGTQSMVRGQYAPGSPALVKGGRDPHVIGSDPNAIAARTHLANLGMHSNDAANGVFLAHRKYGNDPLPSGVPLLHNEIHTPRYFAEVYKRLMPTRSAAEAKDMLQQIARELQQGKFPY